MWTQKQIFQFMKKEYAAIFDMPMTLDIQNITQNTITIRAALTEPAFRPVKIVSGPTLMTLADLTVYALLLAKDKEKARFSVTTSLNISFLSALKTDAVIAQGTILKYGKTLINADVKITDAQKPNCTNPATHATLTYYNAATAETAKTTIRKN